MFACILAQSLTDIDIVEVDISLFYNSNMEPGVI